MENFKQRSVYSPDDVYIHVHLGHEYIPIHPFSDELELLKRLDLAPEACLVVDAYWNIGYDVCFLQVEVNPDNPGIFILWQKEGERGLSVGANITQASVSRTIFEDVMTQIIEDPSIREKIRREIRQAKRNSTMKRTRKRI